MGETADGLLDLTSTELRLLPTSYHTFTHLCNTPSPLTDGFAEDITKCGEEPMFARYLRCSDFADCTVEKARMRHDTILH
eukprot:7018607-Pyramimonas_sp.AAC.1